MRIQFTSKDGSAVQGWIESDTPFIKNVFRIFFAVTLDAETPKGCPFSYSFYTSYNDEEDPYFVSGASYTERLDWLPYDLFFEFRKCYNVAPDVITTNWVNFK
jgi:hypothetical protein